MIPEEQIIPLLKEAFTDVAIPLPGRISGKVRESYPLPDNRRLLVTTDRLSAFDRVLAAVPFKGQVLNQLSAWWFTQTRDIINNHLVSLPDPNALLAVDAGPFPIEVIVRGYITGVTSTALWYRYSIGEREIYGYTFPEGLHKNEPLLEPIITPTTKGGITGHDERLTCRQVVEQGYLDGDTWDMVSTAALALFKRGQQVASRAGLILVDTKYEFGFSPEGQVMLIDEVHTPDSSRFWKADTYTTLLSAEEEPENFDKEFIRIAYAREGYRGDGAAPAMPDDLWVAVSRRYIQIYESLTGQEFLPGPYPVTPRLLTNLEKEGIL